MTDSAYKVVFSGKIAPGHEPAEVRQRLAKLSGGDQQKVDALFDGRKHVIKKAHSLEEAKKLAEHLSRTGIELHVESPARQQAPAAPKWAKSGFFYTLRLVGVAAGMLLLPALHLLLVLTLSLALLWHGFANLWLYDSDIPLGALLHLGPLFIGFGALLLLAKPLLMFWPAPAAAHKVDTTAEPDLWAFVRHISEALGAPSPERIEVDCGAEIRVRAGRQRRLVLTLGLPLVASLTIREFAGLLASRLGPYSTGLAGRLGALICTIDNRLQRALEEEDVLDLTLSRLAGEGPAWIQPVVRAARTLIRVSRHWPALLLKLARRINATTLLRMEVEADRFLYNTGGTDVMAPALLKRRLTTLAVQQTNAGIAQSWEARSTASADFPAAVLHKVTAYPPKIRQRALPAHDRRRIERAAPDAPPLLYCTASARSVFTTFAQLCRRATYRHYRNTLRLPLLGHRLTEGPTGGERTPQERALDEVWGVVTPLLSLCPDKPTDSGEPLPRRLGEARRQAGESANKLHQALAGYKEQELIVLDGLQQELEIKAGLRPRLAPRVDLEALELECRDHEDALDAAVGRLQQALEPARQRVGLALALLQLPESDGRIKGAAAARSEATAAVGFLRQLQPVLPNVKVLREQLLLLEGLLIARRAVRNGKLEDRIGELSADIGHALAAMRVALRETRVPWEKEKIAAHLNTAAPPRETEEALLERATQAYDRLTRLQRRAAGRLALITLAVERAWAV